MSRSRLFVRLLVSVLLLGALPVSALAQSSREQRQLERARKEAQTKLAKRAKSLTSAQAKLEASLNDRSLWTAYERALAAVAYERDTLHAIAKRMWKIERRAMQDAAARAHTRAAGDVTLLRSEMTRLEDRRVMDARLFDRDRKNLRDEISQLGKRATRRQAKHAGELAAAKGVERGLRDQLSRFRARRVRLLQRDLDQRLVKLDLQGKSPRAVLAELTRLTGAAHTLPQADAPTLPASVRLKVDGQQLRTVLDQLAGKTGTTWRREADRIVFHRSGKERQTKTGLRVQELVVAKGKTPRKGETLVLHYSLWIEGKLIDSSRDRGQPLRVVVDGGKVIKGFAEGIADLRVGAKRRLVVPPALGYGAKGKGPVPPNATLVFEVELLEVARSSRD